MQVRAMEVVYNYFYFSLVVFLPILLLQLSRRKAQKGVQLPPGPYAWPIIGNLLEVDAKKPHIALANLAKSYGPLMSLRLGSRLIIVASTPAAAREIYKTHDLEFSGRYMPQKVQRMPDINRSTIALVGECNENWRVLRANVYTELFSSQALEYHSHWRVKKAKQMLDFLSSKEGEVVNVSDVIFATIANTWTRILVSQDIIKCLDKIGEVKRSTRRLVEFVIPGLSDLYPAIFGLLDGWGSQKKAAGYAQMSRLIWDDMLSQRKGISQDGGIQSRDFLEAMIRNSWDENQIYIQLTELFATAETVAIAVEWAMAELTRNQKALAKLGDEIAEVVEEGNILRECHLHKLPYLQACIKETLRLHPPTPLFLPRRALQSCSVMNHIIPKSCLVLVNGYAVGRDPMTWEDPLSFKPERFLNKKLHLRGDYGLVPFGGGRRFCAGYPLAMKETQLLLASLVHAFHWCPPPGIDPAKLDMSETFGTTLGRENPLLLIPKKRNDTRIE